MNNAAGFEKIAMAAEKVFTLYITGMAIPSMAIDLHQ